jgi:hypothetical protein
VIFIHYIRECTTSRVTHERPFRETDDCLGDGIYDRKYIARRGPSISPINSSIAFRLRPITIYLRGRGVTPPTNPEKKGALRRCGGGTAEGSRRKRGDSPRESPGPRGQGQCVKRLQAAGVFGRGEMKISRRYLSPEKPQPRPYFASHKSINEEDAAEEDVG